MERLSNPIFIGGCGSSGTTLLRKMLNMHPNVAVGPELSVFDRPELYSMDMNMFMLDPDLRRNGAIDQVFHRDGTNTGQHLPDNKKPLSVLSGNAFS